MYEDKTWRYGPSSTTPSLDLCDCGSASTRLYSRRLCTIDKGNRVLSFAIEMSNNIPITIYVIIRFHRTTRSIHLLDCKGAASIVFESIACETCD